MPSNPETDAGDDSNSQDTSAHARSRVHLLHCAFLPGIFCYTRPNGKSLTDSAICPFPGHQSFCCAITRPFRLSRRPGMR